MIIIVLFLGFTLNTFAEIHEIITNPNLKFKDVLPIWSVNEHKRRNHPPEKDLVVDCHGDSICEAILNTKSYQELKELYETIDSTPLKLPLTNTFHTGRCFSNLENGKSKKSEFGAMFISLSDLKNEVFLFSNKLFGADPYPADYADNINSQESLTFKRLLLSYGEIPFDYRFANNQNGKETILGEIQGGVRIIGKIKQISKEIFLVRVVTKESTTDNTYPIEKDSYCKIMKKNF